MIFRNLSTIFPTVGKQFEMVCSWKHNFLNLQKYYFSSKPINLSSVKFLPDVHSNTTPIIILHGFLGSKQNWRGLGKAIAKKSGRQVYVLDARNHGDSPHSDVFSYSAMCDDVRHFMNKESISRVVLLGHSMGGRTAMKLALTEKEMIDKLVVVDISPIRMPRSSSTLIPSYLVAMKEAIDSVQNLEYIGAKKMIHAHLTQSVPDVGIRQFLMTNLVEREKKIEWKANIDVLQRTFVSEICDFSDFAGYYLGDTLFICGEESPHVKKEEKPLIREKFPKAEFVFVPGAGHWVHSERPLEFLEALCNFL